MRRLETPGMRSGDRSALSPLRPAAFSQQRLTSVSIDGVLVDIKESALSGVFTYRGRDHVALLRDAIDCVANKAVYAPMGAEASYLYVIPVISGRLDAVDLTHGLRCLKADFCVQISKFLNQSTVEYSAKILNIEKDRYRLMGYCADDVVVVGPIAIPRLGEFSGLITPRAWCDLAAVYENSGRSAVSKPGFDFLTQSPAKRLAAFSVLLRDVSCLHAHGLVHCDIKPANVFLTALGLRLGDLGLVTANGAVAKGGTTGFRPVVGGASARCDYGYDKFALIKIVVLVFSDFFDLSASCTTVDELDATIISEGAGKDMNAALATWALSTACKNPFTDFALRPKGLALAGLVSVFNDLTGGLRRGAIGSLDESKDDAHNPEPAPSPALTQKARDAREYMLMRHCVEQTFVACACDDAASLARRFRLSSRKPMLDTILVLQTDFLEAATDLVSIKEWVNSSLVNPLDIPVTTQRSLQQNLLKYVIANKGLFKGVTLSSFDAMWAHWVPNDEAAYGASSS
jgi:hypothetical protein